MSAAEPEVVTPETPAPIAFCKEDVKIIDYAPMCTECDEEPATKLVMLDFRSLGQEVAFGNGALCGECATEVADRIREPLPNYKEDE